MLDDLPLWRKCAIAFCFIAGAAMHFVYWGFIFKP